MGYNPITKEDVDAFCALADEVTARMCRTPETAHQALVDAGIITEEEDEDMSKKMVTDKIGNTLEVGDIVAYGRSKGDEIHFGTVSAVNVGRNTITVKNEKTGRNSVNSRAGDGVLNVSHLTEMFPEYFI